MRLRDGPGCCRAARRSHRLIRRSLSRRVLGYSSLVEPQFTSLSELRRFALGEGVSAQALFGEGAMLNLVELMPDALIPPHSHPHEQLGVVLRGQLKFVVAGHEHVLAEMDAYALPGDVEHQAQAGSQGALVLDVFQPVREDYRDAAQ